jgi:hypothetical protein
MSHEIEANFISESLSEERQCRFCTSFDAENGFCSEAQAAVPETGYCDFFQSRD